MRASTWLFCALLFLGGCHSLTGTMFGGDELTNEQYESIRLGMTAAEIVEIYGEPNEVVRSSGRVVRLTYNCWDHQGKYLRTADLAFDRDQVLLTKKVY